MAFRYDYYVINGALEKKRLTAKSREAFYGWVLVELNEYEYEILSSILLKNNSLADCLKELYIMLVQSNDIDEQSYVKLTKALASQDFFVEVYVQD